MKLPELPSADALDGRRPADDAGSGDPRLWVVGSDLGSKPGLDELCRARDRDRAMNAPADGASGDDDGCDVCAPVASNASSRAAVVALEVSSSMASRSRTPRARLPTNSKSHASKVSN